MVITVQQAVKRNYQKLLYWSALGAVVILGAMFTLTPAYVPNPYKLKEEIFEVIEIPEDIEIPPPPQEVEMPKVRVEIEISDEASDDDTIEDTSFDFADEIPPPVASSDAGGPENFFAFDEPPQPIYQPSPHYPELAREAEMEGVVIVHIYVDERGNVFNARVLHATVPRILQDEALKAARKWRFKPGKQRNNPVRTVISVPFEFTLH